MNENEQESEKREYTMTGIDKQIFNATRTLTSLLNDACNHWNYLRPYLEKLARVADDALRGYQKDYPEQVAELIDYRRARDSQGNAAAMREALAKIRGIAKTFMDATRMRHVTDSARIDVGDIQELANAALVAPARNCDRYEDAPSAYADFIVPWKLDGHLDDVPTLQDFANWLFAPATEKEGEGDGR